MRKNLALSFGALFLAVLLIPGLMLAWPAPNPSSLDGITYEPAAGPPEARPDTEYTARDGESLPLRVYPAADTDRVLILIHGIALDGDSFHDVASHIAEESTATVYVPDLRNHGQGTDPEIDIDRVDRLENDIVDLVEYIRDDNPDARIFVGGHSAGGGITLRVASSGKLEDIEGYIFIAPLLGTEAPTAREDSGGLVDIRLPRVIALSLLNAVGISAFDGMSVLRVNWPEEYHDDRLTIWYSWRAARALAPEDYARDLESIEVPLLLVAGEKDEVFRGDRYADVIEEHVPHGDTVIKPGFDHFDDVLSNPETLEVYSSWLAER